MVQQMQTRRQVITGAGSAVVVGLAADRARAEPPILTDDGLYRESWFIESFLDLADDLAAAGKAGKRLVVMWELRGCPYCRETHLVNFARPDIADYVRSNFDVLQLNIVGSRKVTDFDGAEVGENKLAAKYGIHYTPTLQFFPPTPAALRDKPAAQREVSRVAGYLLPDDFLAMFRYVRENVYETRTFRDFLRSARS
jgi:thioredoxin-related protein